MVDQALLSRLGAVQEGRDEGNPPPGRVVTGHPAHPPPRGEKVFEHAVAGATEGGRARKARVGECGVQKSARGPGEEAVDHGVIGVVLRVGSGEEGNEKPTEGRSTHARGGRPQEAGGGRGSAPRPRAEEPGEERAGAHRHEEVEGTRKRAGVVASPDWTGAGGARIVLRPARAHLVRGIECGARLSLAGGLDGVSETVPEVGSIRHGGLRVTEVGARRDHTRSVAPGSAADKRDGRSGRTLPGLWRILAGIALLLAVPLQAQDVPPDEEWRTLSTPHFRLAFPERLEALGRRSALLAEAAWSSLAEVFVEPPDETIELILTDHVDASNGFARVAPRLQIVVHARPPVDGQALAYYDDWLHVVLVHELAHIFHLDRTGWIGGVGRRIFGRAPSGWPLFPGQAVPRWVTEGIATWFESSLTGTGRAEGSEFEMYLRTAALAGALESIDRASGDSPLWPGGQRPYKYGSLFFAWLTDRHGPERIADFVEAVAGQWVPYRLDAAARSVFGTSLREEWRRWAAASEVEAGRWAAEVRARSPDLPRGDVLTEGARVVARARVSPDGRWLAYHRADARSDPRIVVRRWDAERGREGDEAGSIRTNGGGAFDWLPDGRIVFSQLETDGRWRMWSDLHVATPDGAEVRRVSHGARLDHPSALPAGDEVVAIRSHGGHTDLVRVALDDGRVDEIASGSDSVHWALPAVSPDGRFIAASRWTPETTWEVVVVDAASGALLLRLDPRRAVALGASWGPDGRTVVFTSDRSGVANLYRRDVDPAAGTMGPLRQMTDLVTGVHLPAVAADGSGVLAALFTPEGWELARWPWPGPDREPVPPREPDDPAAGVRLDAAALDLLEVRPYGSLATFRPTYWEPLVEAAIHAGGRRVAGPWIGGGTTITDMVGRHSLRVAAQVGIERGLLDARGSWRWLGWGDPAPTLSVAQEWRVDGPLALDAAGADSALVQTRSRRAELGTAFYRARFRSSLSLSVGAGILREDRTLLHPVDLRPHPTHSLLRPSATLGDLRVGATVGTARRFALSLSEARGMRLSVVGRRRTHLALADSIRGRPGTDRSVDEVVVEAAGWTSFEGWGWTDHTLAVRGSLGVGTGPGSGGIYLVGGAAGQPETISGFELFGGRALTFPVRGFERGARRGSRAWSASAEWRFPLALVRRGPGLLPGYLESFSGTLFADAGRAWEVGDEGEDSPLLTSVGAEIGMDSLLFFTVSLRLRVGVAAALAGGEGVRAYVRLGPSF